MAYNKILSITQTLDNSMLCCLAVLSSNFFLFHSVVSKFFILIFYICYEVELCYISLTLTILSNNFFIVNNFLKIFFINNFFIVVKCLFFPYFSRVCVKIKKLKIFLKNINIIVHFRGNIRFL